MNSLEIRPLIFGMIGVVIITLRWFWLRKKIPRWTLAPAAVCVAYFFFRAWMSAAATPQAGTPGTTLLYYADQGFGFNPSLLANHWIERLHLFGFISIVYESLMLAIACTYAYSLGLRGQPLRVLVLMILAGVVGSQAYRIMPACGPVYLLGSPCYLGQEAPSCAAISAADLHPVGINPVSPRNATPSMHVAWALLAFWVWRSSRWRWVALAYLLLTVVSTLGGGEHYFVDVVAAFPFARRSGQRAAQSGASSAR